MKKFLALSVVLISMICISSSGYASVGSTKFKPGISPTVCEASIFVAIDNVVYEALNCQFVNACNTAFVSNTEKVTLTFSTGTLPDPVMCPVGYRPVLTDNTKLYSQPFVDTRWVWNTSAWRNS